MKKKLLLVIGLFISAITIASLNFRETASATVPGINIRANVNALGQQSGEAHLNMVSRDGRFVAFQTATNNFIGTDWNYATDVFVRNLTNNTTSRVSVSSSGVESDKGGAYPAISETGRYVVFSSSATNLIDGRTITTPKLQMYMRDTINNTTTLLTEMSPNVFANGSTSAVNVSTDGRFILFTSDATNLGPTVTNSPHANLYLMDRTAGTIIMVNDVPEVGPSSSISLSVSDAQMNCDGSMIVFEHWGADPSYVAQNVNSHVDLYLFDRRAGDRYTNVTAHANTATLGAKISCNGNYIGFASKATNLDTSITDTTMNNYHAYVYDRIDGVFTVADESSSGITSSTGVFYQSDYPLYLDISDKGLAVFTTPATDLVSTNTEGNRQVYVRNVKNGVTELISRDSSGVAGNQESTWPTISLDGKLVVYDTYANNLVANDTNNAKDVILSETGQ